MADKQDAWIKKEDYYPGDKYINDYILTKDCDDAEEPVVLHWIGRLSDPLLGPLWKPVPKGFCPHCQRGK